MEIDLRSGCDEDMGGDDRWGSASSGGYDEEEDEEEVEAEAVEDGRSLLPPRPSISKFARFQDLGGGEGDQWDESGGGAGAGAGASSSSSSSRLTMPEATRVLTRYFDRGLRSLHHIVEAFASETNERGDGQASLSRRGGAFPLALAFVALAFLVDGHNHGLASGGSGALLAGVGFRTLEETETGDIVVAAAAAEEMEEEEEEGEEEEEERGSSE